MALSDNPGLAEASLEQHPHRRIQALEHAHLAARGLQYGIQPVPAGQRDGPAFALIVLSDDRRLQGTRLK
jgi:hypothetical protein